MTETAPESTARTDLERTLTTALPQLDLTPITDAVLDAGWQSPDDVNVLRNQAIAHNSLMWQLALALGVAQDGDEVIDVDKVALVDDALAAIARDTAARAEADA